MRSIQRGGGRDFFFFCFWKRQSGTGRVIYACLRALKRILLAVFFRDVKAAISESRKHWGPGDAASDRMLPIPGSPAHQNTGGAPR